MASLQQISMNSLPPVFLTDKALAMVQEAMKMEDAEQKILRIAVMDGGCSGLQYHLSFSETPSQGDVTFSQDSLRIAVEGNSVTHISGTVIDYIHGLNETGFRFNNPNVTKACKCGTSFRTAEAVGSPVEEGCC